MANHIMNSDALDSAAGQVSGIAGNFASELSSLGALVQSTHEFWNDPAQQAFEMKYEQFKGTMNQFIEALNEYSSKMHSYAENHRQQEIAGAQSFGI